MMHTPHNNRFFLILVGLFGGVVFLAIFMTSRILIAEYTKEMFGFFALSKSDGIENRMAIAKDRVHSIIQYVDAEQQNSDTMIKEKIKKSVDTAHGLLSAYYARNHLTTSNEAMKKAMLDMLRLMRWDNGRGYYFIINLNGIEELNPLNVSLEGTNVSALYDATGKLFVQEMLDKVRTDTQGYVEYTWTKNESIHSLDDRKISYVRLFEPFGWIIATGEYPKDYQAEVQKNVLEKLQNIRFEDNENNYIFVYDIHRLEGGKEFATMLINPNRPDLVGQKISDDVKDANGKLYRKEMLQTIAHQNEGFVKYVYRAPQNNHSEEKISYFIYYPAWRWVIATGLYLGDIEAEYADNIANLSQKVDEKIGTFKRLFLFLGIILIIFAVGVLQFQKKRMEKTADEIAQINEKLQEQVDTEVIQRMVLEDEKNTREKLFIQHAKMAEMGEMISVISHQWKQPLNNISLLSQEISELQKFGELDDAAITHITEGITQQLAFMLQTIDDFRDFFKPDKEKQHFRVSEAIQSVLKIFAIQIKVYDIVVNLYNHSDHDTVYGVENELKQVVLNILNNAKDIFIEKQRLNNEVSIHISTLHGAIVIVMEDNAGGIEPSLLPEKIFESYVSTKGEQGTGIGLSMSKMIVEKRFNGTISASNTNEGARFEIVLPYQHRGDLS